MDYIYAGRDDARARRPRRSVARIFAHMSTRPSAHAVRYRPGLLAQLNRRCRLAGGRRVFALGRRHLREVDLSVAAQNGVFDDFVAMDQDEASLAVRGPRLCRPWRARLDRLGRQLLSERRTWAASTSSTPRAVRLSSGRWPLR